MKSCLYRGWVEHHRHVPVQHGFRYWMFQVYLDLDELPDVFRGRWFWSTQGFSLAWFRRRDHLGDPEVPLKIAVLDLVEERSGTRPDGAVRLLTHLRYFGYCMNPVSLYFCFDSTDRRVQSIVAEVHNTPWGETHCYVLPVSKGHDRQDDGFDHRFRIPKEFHVSPFMGMDVEYVWHLTDPGDRLALRIENFSEEGKIFEAALSLRRQPISGRALSEALLRYPPMTFKVVGAIYWQALRLWWKRCPFHPHPKHGHARETRSS